MIDFAVQRIRSFLPRAGAVLLGLAVAVSLSACGDDGNGGSGMQGPTVEQSISSQSVTSDQGTVDVADLSNVFSGENLSFQVSSSASDVVSASTDGSTLTINPQNGGSAAVSATASNDAGSAQTSFDVEVTLPDAPGPPNGQ
jgi:hypothetical protein